MSRERANFILNKAGKRSIAVATRLMSNEVQDEICHSSDIEHISDRLLDNHFRADWEKLLLSAENRFPYATTSLTTFRLKSKLCAECVSAPTET
jgi:hypothetical protein